MILRHTSNAKQTNKVWDSENETKETIIWPQMKE